MPTIIKYRKYCKTCDDFKLFDYCQSILCCESCKEKYEKVPLEEIDEVKVLQQRNRYRKYELDSLNNMLFNRKNPIAELFSEPKVGYEVREDDAGFLEAQRQSLAEYNKKRKENFELKEKFAKVGRNDVCLCGSGKKYKKCCLIKVEKLF